MLQRCLRLLNALSRKNDFATINHEKTLKTKLDLNIDSLNVSLAIIEHELE